MVTIPTSDTPVDDALVDGLTRLVADAAALVQRAAAAAGEVSLKSDGTPVTAADLAADACLAEGLARLMPDIPVVSEERALPSSWPCPEIFVLVDPLDGTKEFIAGRPEYAINLAIVIDRRPIVGLIALPAFGSVYRGIVGRAAERLPIGESAPPGPFVATPVHVRRAPAVGLTALTSRSHRDTETEAFLAGLAVTERQHLGSALKFCRVAEGTADVYARLATTHEWDIAAGEAIIEAAGGRMTGRDGETLSYGRADCGFLVSGFVAWGDPGLFPSGL